MAVKSYANMLGEMSNAMNGALNSEEIIIRMERYGYTSERITEEGLNRLDNVHQLFALQRKEYGEQHDANAVSTDLQNETRSAYMDHVRLSRIALKNFPGALHSISATGSRKRSVAGFLKEARTFYLNMLDQPRLLEAMERFNITAEELQAGLDRVDKAEKSYQVFLKEKGEAQDSTIVRDEAFDELYNWYSEFRAVARIALADRPQLLEKMGIIVKR